uniref:RanBD1 domain-containing protein n=1 Tax=Hyaloperonospora arabidopsidis (strain Emoy2) TaxID=559515 RepID=M4C6J4_HYAAE
MAEANDALFQAAPAVIKVVASVSPTAEVSDAPLKDARTPLSHVDDAKVMEVARDAVLKDAPRAAKGEDSAVATALAEPPKSRRRISSFSWPPAGTSFPPCAGEDAVDVVCVKNVVLETTRDDGEIDRSTLQMDLVLRKEVGNARLVSGDAVLWVGNGVLSHKDSTVDSVPTRTVRIENRKRRFVFTVVLDAVGKQFYADLKDQVDAKARV